MRIPHAKTHDKTIFWSVRGTIAYGSYTLNHTFYYYAKIIRIYNELKAGARFYEAHDCLSATIYILLAKYRTSMNYASVLEFARGATKSFCIDDFQTFP